MTISMGRLTLTENRRKRPRWILFTYQSIEFNSSSISNGLARWCEMITELELYTDRQNDKSFVFKTVFTLYENKTFSS